MRFPLESTAPQRVLVFQQALIMNVCRSPKSIPDQGLTWNASARKVGIKIGCKLFAGNAYRRRQTFAWQWREKGARRSGDPIVDVGRQDVAGWKCESGQNRQQPMFQRWHPRKIEVEELLSQQFDRR
jgi:hypothetical protein